MFLERTYEEFNLVTVSGKYTINDFNKLVQNTIALFRPYAKNTIEHLITTTKAVEVINNEQILDVEILFPVSSKIEVQKPYVYKDKIKITNALYLKVNDITKLQEAMNRINQYVIEEKIQPITTAYLVQTTEEGKPVVEIYMGINPNII